MLDFIKRKFKKNTKIDNATDEANINSNASLESNTTEAKSQEKQGLFARFKASLARTGKNFTEKIVSLVAGKKQIDDELLDELENILLGADVGIEVTDKVLTSLTEELGRNELSDSNVIIHSLKEKLFELIKKYEAPFSVNVINKPFVILMIGVNGAGKTTSIGKLTKYLKSEGKSVLLAAGDTFRAAAVEQLKVWGDRNDVPVISQGTGSDSASVIYDAYQSAKAKGIDVLIADTAGRLHTKQNLMDELSKIEKILKKLDNDAPHEVMLVLDSTIGQNAVEQAKHFNKAVKIDSLIINKLDGTAKGGVVFAVTDKVNVPIKFVGLGEGIDDLKPFNAKYFIDALFEESSNEPE